MKIERKAGYRARKPQTRLVTEQITLLLHNAKECPRRDLNPHSLGETDFKSAASTIPPLGQYRSSSNLIPRNR